MAETQEQVITPSIIDNAMTYDEFRQLVDDLLEKDETTGGPASDEVIHYTKMNVQRMNRLEKTIELNDEIKNQLKDLDESWIWLVLVEGWCGDVAQNLPIIQKMADESSNIELKLILRDKHTKVMDHYLTNGKSRSIPKLVVLQSDDLEEVGTWGPRPQPAQQLVLDKKDDPDLDFEEMATQLHKWYADDKGKTIQSEFQEKLKEWAG